MKEGNKLMMKDLWLWYESIKIYLQNYMKIIKENPGDKLGATTIEKIPKISASGQNFLDPLPPLLEKGPYR